MSVSSHPSPTDLLAFLAGRLEDEHQSTIESHLARCEPCGESLVRCDSGEAKIFHSRGTQQVRYILGGQQLSFQASDFKPLIERLNPHKER